MQENDIEMYINMEKNYLATLSSKQTPPETNSKTKLQNQLSIIYIQLKKQKEKNTNFFSLGNKKQGNNDKEEQ